MIDKLKKCSFIGNRGDISLEFESSSPGMDKTLVINPAGILELILGIQEITQEANDSGSRKKCRSIKGLMPLDTSFELYQYKFFSSKDMSHMILHFLNNDNSSYGFPLTRESAIKMGEELIAQAETLNAGSEEDSETGSEPEDTATVLRLVK